ncbi:MAG: primosomal protein N' [Deltaproteobacteria bacterium]|nr:primosomal protein N' [Deltaproteobacteria bacterium]
MTIPSKTEGLPKVAEVAVPLPLLHTFHYEIPLALKDRLQEGFRVLVPFKNRKFLGTVVGFSTSPYKNLKTILDSPDPTPLFSHQMLEFLKRMASHYAAPLGEVLKMALPNFEVQKSKKVKPYLLESLSPEEKETILLTPSQKEILEELKKALTEKCFSPFLLHGVTGSGKTEIYLRIIQEALTQKKEALVLVPEISLTPQLLSRFESCFPGKIAVLHSRLTSAQRREEWLKIKNKKASIALGARSALFAPFENIGVIVIDEEHDSSFKQEEKVRYNAKDMALIRGQLEKAVVILGSATPALESYFNVQQKKIKLLRLPERISSYPLPLVEIVDLKKTQGSPTQVIFSDPLLKALEETLLHKNQAILLLNRRGYAAVQLCQECGYSAKCPHCSVSLTVYTKQQKLICHYCFHTLLISSRCPDCKSSSFTSLGLGTEKVEEELRRFYPEARIARMDRSSTQKKETLGKILSDFSKQKTDILIGTQMVAKGHDFPNVTLVGVILADIGLHVPDFRAPERTFQLLTQVAGRAGRGEKGGRVIIQTFNPSHYSLQFAKTHDTLGFYETELKERQELQYPPFSKLIHFKTSHSLEKKGYAKIQELSRLCQSILKSTPEFAALELLGPAPAPLSKLKDKYRFHLLLKSPSYKLARAFLNQLLKQDRFLSKQPSIQIDVDPLNLL